LSVLDFVNSSDDVKKIDKAYLNALCSDIRKEILSSVSRNGGHLASGLGAVELTVAIHRVYDTSKDRLIFDVGHQSYPHKIITGRRRAFEKLRQKGGASGFPCPYESVDDAFISGHASNAISVALGMARARSLSGCDYDVVAVVGDGALTGGLAYEGLCDAARSNEPLVIIINDNNMSIDHTVGGTESMLEIMRTRPAYINFKRRYRKAFKPFPHIYSFNHKVKEYVKKKLLKSNMFSEMGFYYLGPVDGHNIENLEAAIQCAKEMRIPAVVHVITQKGKGYKFSEDDPEKFHGVAPFDLETGKLLCNKVDFSAVFGSHLCDLADKDERIVAITAAMSSGTGLTPFAEAFPKRFFDVGIAEEHAVSMASGMAKQGMIPVFAVYSTFLQRSLDQLIHDTALQSLHTVFCVDRAGVVGQDGETHNGVFDIAYLSLVPNMTVLCPAGFNELKAMLDYAIYNINGPVAVRYPRGSEMTYRDCSVEAETVLCEGNDITVVCYGILTSEAISACRKLKEMGISAELIKLGTVYPNDFSTTIKSLKKTGRFLIAEDVCADGCIGQKILACSAQHGIPLTASALINLGNGIVQHASVSEIWHDYMLDSDGIVQNALDLIRKVAE